MPVFHYKGYKPDGSHVSGTLEADGLRDAIASVKDLDIFPREVGEYTHRESRWLPRKNNNTLLPHITRQLSMLLSSGVPLMEALKSLSDESKGFWKGVLVDIRERVSGGSSLSRALEGYPQIFPEFYINMVSAGEQSSMLDKILARLSDFLDKQVAIKEKIRIAMIYPALMVCVGFIVLSFLFTFVIPKIVRIFESSKSALPLITVILIGISNFFLHYWWVVIGLATVCIAGFRKLKEERKDLIDRAKLKAPGGIVQSLYFMRFTRTLGFLLDGKLPVLKALELSAKSIGNTILEENVRKAVKKVAEGARLSSSLGGFPPVLLQLMATGEKGGTLPEVLNKAADSYEDEFGRRVQKALSLLEPSMILVMGILVGFIVFAVLLPMFQLNQLVK
ncbi:MAG: type II secretion system F family protein [Nitrospirae bacterium]|nr:type II secretion system F family protein [Nitrospirota bacterium]MCL5236389.1 type II secretion system F family protein [Nitrospirota bacterium]